MSLERPMPANQGVDHIALPQGIAQPLEHEKPGSLADDEAVCLNVERRRPAPC